MPSKSNTAFVCGIPCRLQSAASRRAVARVLRQINQRFPKDFERLLARVRLVRPVPKRRIADGTRGEWIGRTFEQAYCNVDFSSWPENIRLQSDECESGIVELAETGQTESEIVATAAHEFGHACSMKADLDRRHAPYEEWGSEAAADWYAYKWGFGKLIRATSYDHRIGHHGALPGEVIETEGVYFKMSRNHVYSEIGKAAGEAEFSRPKKGTKRMPDHAAQV